MIPVVSSRLMPLLQRKQDPSDDVCTSFLYQQACKLYYRDHPEVNYKPGPFNLGKVGGAICNIIAIAWTAFEVIILVSCHYFCQVQAKHPNPVTVCHTLLTCAPSHCIRYPQIMPTIYPVTATNMNYSSIITVGVMLLAGLWYFISARKYYDGPRSNLDKSETLESKDSVGSSTPSALSADEQAQKAELEDVPLDRKN